MTSSHDDLPVPSARKRPRVFRVLIVAAVAFAGLAAYGIFDRNHSDAELASWTDAAGDPQRRRRHAAVGDGRPDADVAGQCRGFLHRADPFAGQRLRQGLVRRHRRPREGRRRPRPHRHAGSRPAVRAGEGRTGQGGGRLQPRRPHLGPLEGVARLAGRVAADRRREERRRARPQGAGGRRSGQRRPREGDGRLQGHHRALRWHRHRAPHRCRRPGVGHQQPEPGAVRHRIDEGRCASTYACPRSIPQACTRV